MRILISPAKQMIHDPDTLAPASRPRFLSDARLLLETLRQKSDRELQALWKTNDALTAENIERVRTMDLTRNLTPALFAYHGIQYQYLGAAALEDEALGWLCEHLRIGSGFYGLLRPLDGIVPYRLEMQARLRVGLSRDLYAFWGDRLARALAEETDTVLDLASREYSRAVLDPLPPTVRVIRCVFLSRKPDGSLAEKATLCKMARGRMARFLAEAGQADLATLQAFDGIHWQYAPELSEPDRLVYLEKPSRPGTRPAFQW